MQSDPPPSKALTTGVVPRNGINVGAITFRAAISTPSASIFWRTGESILPAFSNSGLTPAGSRAWHLPHYACTPAIFSHSSAQRSHASAHFCEYSSSCLRHSSAQTLQISATNSESPLMSSDAVRHKVEQSRSSSIVRATIFASRSPRYWVAHHVHSFAQLLQASMQFIYLLFAIYTSC
jgi:hypothetical protein